MEKNQRFSVIIAILFLAGCFPSLRAQQKDSLSHLTPRVIHLNIGEKDYTRILGGPPETSTMRSGFIQLSPGKSVGKHNTEKFEEMVIVMNGSAEMLITGGKSLHIEKGDAAYCPPHTEHDVRNAGTDTLRYIYVVAESK
jgi:mannose-6-phosphate isomerase-like protein (cupin superfamily)